MQMSLIEASTFGRKEQSDAREQSQVIETLSLSGQHPCEVSLYSLVTAVPLPGVAWPAGKKVCCPLVLDSLGEPQQHAGVVVSNIGSIG